MHYMENRAVDFYLGANTATGFVSLFDQLYDDSADSAVIIKGGSGTGKSTLMKKIAAAAENENRGLVERIHCSSDPDSLDAVIFRDGKCCIADGTAPHITDPKWPGAVDSIINMGDHWDAAVLKKSKSKIVELVKRKKKIYEEVYRYLDAATDAYREIRVICEQFVRYDKMNDDISRHADADFRPTGRKGSEKRRVLYSVTPQGYVGFDSTLSALASEITVVKDDYCLGDIYMNKLRARLLADGYDIYVCTNTLSCDNGVDAILVPGVERAYVTSTFLREYRGGSTETLDLKKYLPAAEIKSFKARLSFNRKLAAEMVDQAVSKLTEIRELHGMLEHIYIGAMNFDEVTKLSDKVINSFSFAY